LAAHPPPFSSLGTGTITGRLETPLVGIHVSSAYVSTVANVLWVCYDAVFRGGQAHCVAAADTDGWNEANITGGCYGCHE